ncbi:hypothetical protein TNCV_4883211 [Trichonephila clavipes]|nr:hypothetical protein TNCV_4883211 [Trichonephila clavipes]
MNEMASVFSRHESNRARLGRSRKTSCWPPTTPHKLSKNWKELFWKCGTEYPNSGLIASLIPCLKGAQRCWPSVETVPPTENDFL